MKDVLREKYETIYPDKSEDPGPWIDASQARAGKAIVSRSNRMPPGENIDQPVSDVRAQSISLAGATDRTNDVTSQALKDGFTKIPMKGTDDIVTFEHQDVFYDDVGGFVERGNTLDRN